MDRAHNGVGVQRHAVSLGGALGNMGLLAKQQGRLEAAVPWLDRSIGLLEDVLNGGVAPALARTAAQLREDCDALDAIAAGLLEQARSGAELDVKVLTDAPAAVRRRALRSWLHAAGVHDLSDAQLRSVDALIGEWRGQGGVWLPGALVVSRAHGRLVLSHGATAP